MAVIENYSSQRPLPVNRSSAQDFADTRGLENLSRAADESSRMFQQEGDRLAQVQVALNDEKQRATATKIASEARIEWNKKMIGYQTDPDFSNKFGADASKFSDSVYNEFTEFEKSLEKQYPDNKYLVEYARRLKEDVAIQSINYQAKYAGDFIKSSYSDAIDSAKKLARVDMPQSRKELINIVDSVNGSSLIGPEEKKALIKKATSEVNIAGIEAEIEKNPSEIKESLNKGSFVDKVIAVESGGNPQAKNPNSTATGLGQFIESTWLNLFVEKYPDLAKEKSVDEILELRKDPAFSKEMVKFYADQNASFLKNNGIAVSDASLYLAHFLGPQGAVNLLNSDPALPIEKVLSAGQIKANQSILAGKRVSDVVLWAGNKVGSTSSVNVTDKKMSELFPGYNDLDFEDQEKVKKYTVDYIDSYDQAKKKMLLASQEFSVEQQVTNQTAFKTDVLYNEQIALDERLYQLNKMDFEGRVDKDWATEARRYLTSEKEMSASTDAQVISEIINQAYDLNTIADSNPKDYLLGVSNLEKKINSASADGLISRDDRAKLDKQLTTLTSAKKAGATSAFAMSMGAARKIIESSLPPEQRAEAYRQIFNETIDDRDLSKMSKDDREKLKKTYESEARKIVFEKQQETRTASIQKIESFSSEISSDDIAYISSIGRSMSDVSETAAKYGMTEKQVIEKLRASK